MLTCSTQPALLAMPAMLAMLAMLATQGCEVRSSVLGGADDGAALDAALDSSTDGRAADGGDAAEVSDALPDGTPGPRFASASPKEFQELNSLLQGKWHGSTGYDEVRGPLFEVTFKDQGYTTQCLFRDVCEPFGVGSDGALPDFVYELYHLNEEGLGFGALDTVPFGTVRSLELTELRYSETSDAITFTLENATFSRQPGAGSSSFSSFANVALSRGKYTGPPPAEEPDASVPDAGADAETDVDEAGTTDGGVDGS
jgi:hypothetical protein